MTRFTLLLAPALLLAACAQDADPAAETHGANDAPAVVADEAAGVEAGTPLETFGTALSTGEVLPVSAAVSRADELNGQTVRVEGEVAEVCRMEGCWLTFQTADGNALRVTIPHVDGAEGEEGGHAFTFPRDIAGAHAVVEGTLEVTETSVERRRHLAEDGGATAEEIAAITEPEREIVLNATGATLRRAAGAPAEAPAETAAPAEPGA